MRALEFNAVIAVDLVYMKLFGSEEVLINIIDHGTGFIMVARFHNAQSHTVRAVLWDQWIKHYGHPLMVL